jgi:hypothetical protein
MDLERLKSNIYNRINKKAEFLILSSGNLVLIKRKLAIIKSYNMAKRISKITNSPQTSHTNTHSADSHITTHIG